MQFVLLAVCDVNGKCDRLVFAVITRRKTDYRLSATRLVQSPLLVKHAAGNMGEYKKQEDSPRRLNLTS